MAEITAAEKIEEMEEDDDCATEMDDDCATEMDGITEEVSRDTIVEAMSEVFRHFGHLADLGTITDAEKKLCADLEYAVDFEHIGGG